MFTICRSSRIRGLTHKLLGGWQWSGLVTLQSGTPFSVANGVLETMRASRTASASIQRSLIPMWSAIRVRAFQTSLSMVLDRLNTILRPLLRRADLPSATLHWNLLTNPRRTNFDMALFKHFAITESMGFELRAEAFNVFNHIEYAWLGGDSGSAASNSPFASSNNVLTCYGSEQLGWRSDLHGGNAYLRPAVAHNGRILQLGAKFIF